ncbi:inositol phosphorylceramide synthase [Halorubellus sp. JP-L1]|uniref:phosphatase PAP2 family protein n=1 Tax=Halorubellus sp. JP-L1 TaxID=2715753 RepID=UPI001408F434|nr:phosphatase PAP2 family protein [Halorubellus sp. JP-L1]NHN43118.1 inositol phosphorylceramide synthase [Halorubellus sp. JP-L1]
MSLLQLLASVVAVVAVLHGVGLVAVVGRERVFAGGSTIRRNVHAARYLIAFLGGVLAINKVVRDVGVELSWFVGANVTGGIYAIEGELVATVQSYAMPALTSYFSAVYVYGYVFLLTFPLVAYAFTDRNHPLRVLLVAYTVNYLVGLVMYVAFVAYGPRNYMPELVDSLLYVHWPDVQLLTSRVNRNTNVFPSLHASLSATVAFAAYRFRADYPAWTPIAAWLAASISVATVYLGIHWMTDVVVGVALAAGSVAFALRVVQSDDSTVN